MQSQQPLVVRTEEAEQLLSLSRPTVRKLLAEGELEAVRFGRALRITRASIDALIERRASDVEGAREYLKAHGEGVEIEDPAVLDRAASVVGGKP